jgi:hypothetical protein
LFLGTLAFEEFHLMQDLAPQGLGLALSW